MRISIILSLFILLFYPGCIQEKTPVIITTTTSQSTSTVSTLPLIDYGIYYSGIHGYQIKYPVEWNITEESDGFVVFTSPFEDYYDKFFENLNIVVSKHMGQVYSASKYSDLAKIEFEKVLTSYDQEEVKEVIIEGQRVIKHVYTYDSGNFSLKAAQYIFFIGKDSIVLTYTAEVDKYDKYHRFAEGMFNSFSKIYDLRVSSESNFNYLGEEVRFLLTNKGKREISLSDDLCEQSLIRITDENKTLLKIRRPHCNCTYGQREIIVKPGETKIYTIYPNDSRIGWNQDYYTVRIFNSLCSEPGYEESLRIDDKRQEAGIGKYILKLSYNTPHTPDKNININGDFWIIPSDIKEEKVYPEGPSIINPGNRDHVILTEDDDGFNVTVFNNGRDALTFMRLITKDKAGNEYLSTPSTFHMSAFENKTIFLQVNPFQIFNWANLTLYLDGYDTGILVTIKKDVVTSKIPDLPGIPVFDPLSDQKKYQHGRRSPWD